MALPLKKLRVFPNPWGVITLEHGPQQALGYGGNRDGAGLRYIGARAQAVLRQEREAGDPRGNDTKYVFSFTSLNDALTDGTAEEVPKDPFYFDRIADGSLVPADEATRKASQPLYASLAEARAAGVAKFEADFGPGSFAEQFKGRPFAAAAVAISGSGGSDESGGKPGKGGKS
jgi:hypothetical protein